MLERLRQAPRWVLSVVMGVLFGTGTTIFTLLRGDVAAPFIAIGGGVFGGVFFGWFMGLTLVQQREAARAAAGDIDNSSYSQAVSASARGPVPTDPVVRTAAARIVGHRLDIAERQQRWSLIMFSLLLIVSAVQALTQSPWWWVTSIFWAVLVVAAVVQPRRLQRRLQVLESGSASEASSR